MKVAAAILLLVFGLMGFGVNLFIRAIFLYEDWQNGDEINWEFQLLLTFGVPVAITVAAAESMAILGCFS
jgi:hypothetical protein